MSNIVDKLRMVAIWTIVVVGLTVALVLVLVPVLLEIAALLKYLWS